MTDPPGTPDASNRRDMPRSRSKAEAIILLDTDVMRTGIKASLVDVSVGGVGIACDTPLEEGTHIKLRLQNAIQRFEREVRGVVRRVGTDDDGRCQIGVELFTRLTPLDVTLLRSGITGPSAEGGTVWV